MQSRNIYEQKVFNCEKEINKAKKRMYEAESEADQIGFIEAKGTIQIIEAIREIYLLLLKDNN